MMIGTSRPPWDFATRNTHNNTGLIGTLRQPLGLYDHRKTYLAQHRDLRDLLPDSIVRLCDRGQLVRAIHKEPSHSNVGARVNPLPVVAIRELNLISVATTGLDDLAVKPLLACLLKDADEVPRLVVNVLQVLGTLHSVDKSVHPERQTKCS